MRHICRIKHQSLVLSTLLPYTLGFDTLAMIGLWLFLAADVTPNAALSLNV